MITITNSKVAGMEPKWALFRGISLLFDSPGDCFRVENGRAHLHCRVASDMGSFYRI